MTQHRIFGSEADQPRPLAYIKMFRASRRRVRGYVIAAIVGGLAALVLAASFVVISGGLVAPGS